jgi:Zn finger protein HypA/HybF involved in hydrogenase expression
MQSKSVYCFECICGQHIESETKELTCPRCHRLIEIQWPARENEVLAQENRKTLSAAA